MNPEERLESALRSADPPRVLRSLVGDLAREGRTKGQIYELLEQLVRRLRTHPDYQDFAEDIVLDVMDALTGWCHPDAQLLSDDNPLAQEKRGPSTFPAGNVE